MTEPERGCKREEGVIFIKKVALSLDKKYFCSIFVFVYKRVIEGL